MFDSVVLDVIIALVFIYLLYSLLASIIQEIISSFGSIRARTLKDGISRMLDGEAGKALSESFYKHPLIKYLGEGKWYSKNPAYLSAQNFSKVMIDLLRGQDAKPGENFVPEVRKALEAGETTWKGKDIQPTKIDDDTLAYLRSVWADSQGDLDKFRAALEKWFDDTMDRATGWYKRKIQVILFFIGLGIAITFNVDTIAITKKLSDDPALAKQMADNAAAYLKARPDLGAQLAKTNDSAGKVQIRKQDSLLFEKAKRQLEAADSLIKGEIANTNQLMGLGWECRCPDTCTCHNGKKHCVDKWCPRNVNAKSWIGWLITALALSLGAPFWFDLLNKLMKMRTAVKAPETDDKDKKTEKQAVPPTNTKG